jgi:GNAT superfamily N-acetyltransferase
MTIRIRLATMADIPALEELIHDSVAKLSVGFYTEAQIGRALSHIFGVDTQLILDETYFIAEIDHVLAGSGGWSKRNTLYGGDKLKSRELDRLLDPATEAARLRAFYVHPRWSRRGVGSRVLTECENAARLAGFNRIELAATLPGERLYAARGYDRREALQLEMPNGESLSAYRMTKLL